MEIQGGDLTTNQPTFNLLNATATTLNIGGAATTISLGAATGTTTVNNALTVASGKTFTALGTSTFNPDNTNDVTFETDAGSTVIFNGLQTTTGSIFVPDNSNNLVKCSASSFSLQSAYDAGNTITTTTGRDIAFTLADTRNRR